MKRTLLFQALTLGISTALAACAGSETPTVDTVGASFSISALPGTSPAAAAIVQGDSDSDNDSLEFGGRRIRRANIDSLIVTVTSVQVLPDSQIHRCHPPVGDSLHGFHPGDDDCGSGEHRGPGDPMGPRGGEDDGPHDHPLRPDSLLPPDTGWGSAARQWYTLNVSGSGHLNLLALPTDTTNGLVLASGTLPVGEYGAARLIISSAKIYFDTVITVAGGFTFQPNTAYDVIFPTHDSIMGIMTNAGFTLSTAGANVVLAFDPRAMIGNAIVSNTGQIIVRPSLHPCGRH